MSFRIVTLVLLGAMNVPLPPSWSVFTSMTPAWAQIGATTTTSTVRST